MDCLGPPEAWGARAQRAHWIRQPCSGLCVVCGVSGLQRYDWEHQDGGWH